MKMPSWWYQKNSWQGRLLYPLGWLTEKWSFLRYQQYMDHLDNIWRPRLATVVVGNLSVGGTGKTPMVLFLCKLLQQQDIKAAIISKGYGGTHRLHSKEVHVVSSQDEAKWVGDEPLLMSFANVAPVLICHSRVRAIEWAQQHLQVDCVLLDDGLHDFSFQHDIELCMVDGMRQFGNGYCLPAGPLREPISRLKTVDFVIENSIEDKPRLKSSHGMLKLNISEAINQVTGECQSLDNFRNQSCVAVAGVG